MKCKLGDICTKIGSGATPRGGKDAYCDKGITLVRSQNVLDFSFSDGGLAFINEEQAAKLNNVEVLSGDVLLNITGDSVARACMMDDSFLPARVNQHVAIIRGKNNIVINRYLLYFLQWQKSHLLQLASGGATRNALTKGMIEQLEIELPSLEQQKKIVDILGSLDDIIALNNEINNNLEQQIQALFIAWFVNFIPFSGKIPDDWKNIPFSNFLVQSKEKSDNPNIPMYSVTDTGIFPRSEKFKKVLSMTRAKNKVIRQTDLVFGMSREILNWGIMRDPEGGVSSAYNVYHVDKSVNSFYLESYIKSNISLFKDLIKPASREGQGIDKNALMQKTLLLPTKEVLDKYYEMENAFTRTISQVQEENKNLTEIRDTLLPKLMAGEIDVEGVKI